VESKSVGDLVTKILIWESVEFVEERKRLYDHLIHLMSEVKEAHVPYFINPGHLKPFLHHQRNHRKDLNLHQVQTKHHQQSRNHQGFLVHLLQNLGSSQDRQQRHG
jgi:hypothetical protein